MLFEFFVGSVQYLLAELVSYFPDNISRCADFFIFFQMNYIGCNHNIMKFSFFETASSFVLVILYFFFIRRVGLHWKDGFVFGLTPHYSIIPPR